MVYLRRYLSGDDYPLQRAPLHRQETGDHANYRFRKGFLLAVFVAAPLVGLETAKRLLTANAEEKETSDESESEEEEENPLEWHPPERTDLPTITAEEINQRQTVDDKIWCSFRNGVYDITEFCAMHPGGEIIKEAAGGPLEPLWLKYSFHYQIPVLEILEEMRIGTLDPKDVKEYDLPTSNEKVTDQLPVELDPAMIVHSANPLNAEPPREKLVEKFITPHQYFYKRNHLNVPDINPDEYRLEVEGLHSRKKVFKLEELKRKFKSVAVVSMLQCSGNRRTGFDKIKSVSGISWQVGTVGNAEWKGVLLRDVLKTVGVTCKVPGLEHVQFEGYDSDENEQHYGASVPLEFVFDPEREVILAYEMNGEPIAREHGFPIRVIIPGVSATRCVKWVKKIKVAKEESDSFWQRRDYKSFSPNVDWTNVDYDSAPPIIDFPVQSVICIPNEGEEFPEDTEYVDVKGYAVSGDGRGIIRVDVSSDGGETWQTAKLEQAKGQKLFQMWAWTLWTCRVPLDKSKAKDGHYQLVCKAVDYGYNTQPESPKSIWNYRGFLNTSWHRVNITVTKMR